MTIHEIDRLLEMLVAHSVSFVIIGGHAVNYHGYIRSTEDIDLIFRRDDNSDEGLFSVLKSVNAFWIGDEVDPKTGLEKTHAITPEYVQQQHMLLLGTDVGYADLFDFIPGMPNEPLDDLFADSIQDGCRRFVSLHWLKRLKVASDRPQDRIDLEHLP